MMMSAINPPQRKPYAAIKISPLGNLAELTQGKRGYGADMRGRTRGAMRMMGRVVIIIMRMMIGYRF